ncbi:MAG: hypothetical protein H6672_00985 [Anaerolineaceae bacterium]|nr:hypothetical protein [Anaerolineaceae bacterium]
MSEEKSKKNKALPTIITLTVPTPDDGGNTPKRVTVTLLIQRGNLAHIRYFHYVANKNCGK